MGRPPLIQILLLSLCAHLVIFWPLPASRIDLPGPSKSLHVQLTQADDPVMADVGEPPLGEGGDTVPTPQPRGRLARPQSNQSVSQNAAVSADPVASGVVQDNKPMVTREDSEGLQPQLDLHAYKIAVALAALDFRPPKNGEPSASGTAVVDIHLANGTKMPRVALAHSSGRDAVDTLALTMIRRAVGRVALPALDQEQDGLVRLSVVFEPEEP